MVCVDPRVFDGMVEIVMDFVGDSDGTTVVAVFGWDDVCELD